MFIICIKKNIFLIEFLRKRIFLRLLELLIIFVVIVFYVIGSIKELLFIKCYLILFFNRLESSREIFEVYLVLVRYWVSY